MKLSITYPELSKLVLDKTGQQISFSYAGHNTLSVGFEYVLPIVNEVTKPSIDVMYSKVESNHLYFSLAPVLMTISKITNYVLPQLLKKLPFVTLHDNLFDIDLASIPQLNPILETLTLSDIAIQSDGIDLILALRN